MLVAMVGVGHSTISIPRGRSPVLAAFGGVLLVNLLGLPLGPLSARAAWCWPAKPPKCKAPVVAGGSCEEGYDDGEIPAGGKCTPKCSDGKVPTGSCEVVCPASAQTADYAEVPGCTDDISAIWWVPCSFGDKCINFPQLGTGQYSEYGAYSCVDPSGIMEGCVVVDLPKAPASVEHWHHILFWGVIPVTGISAGLAVLPGGSGLARALFNPLIKVLNLGNILAIVTVVAGLWIYIAGLGYDSETSMMFSSGFAAGIAMTFPMLFAFFKAGIHSVVGISRERAWIIHIIFGDIAFLTGVAHGISAIVAQGNNIFDEAGWICGLVGLVIVAVGISPVALANLGVIKYDTFKLFHMLSFFGYILLVMHMIGNYLLLPDRFTAAAACFANIAVLLLFIAQKIYTKATASKVTMLKADVLSDQQGRHVVLHMQAPSFNYRPGQWLHLQVPSISKVAHPFTIVPGDDAGDVRVCMKVSGVFTAKLADACASNTPPAMNIAGPYGAPPKFGSFDAAVFVLGGVGVTPGLSLVKDACDACGHENVRLNWSVRSPALLERCGPFFDATSLQAEHKSIRFTPGLKGWSEYSGTGAAGESSFVRQETQKEEELPFGAEAGRADYSAWMSEVRNSLASAGKKNAVLFLCGPAAMIQAASKAASSGPGIAWAVHVEHFNFLPNAPPAKQPPAPAVTAVAPAKLGGGTANDADINSDINAGATMEE